MNDKNSELEKKKVVTQSLKILCSLFNKFYSEELLTGWLHYSEKIPNHLIVDFTNHWGGSQKLFPAPIDLLQFVRNKNAFQETAEEKIPTVYRNSEGLDFVYLGKK